MKNISLFIKNNKFNLVVLLLYFVIAGFTLFHHEIWRDEAQAWCIARDLNFSDMFYMTRADGHPLLWYLLLFPFAKTGVNVISMQIISFIFVFSAVVLFLFKSPFNNYIKVLTVFSAGMLYYLPVIARNYSLIPVFIFLLAYLYGDRKEKPVLYAVLIMFLSNTHILMFGFCSILALLFCCELIKDKLNKTAIFSIILLLINFVYIFLCFYGMNSVNHAIVNYSSNTKTIFTGIIQFASTFFVFPLDKFPSFVLALFFYGLIFTFMVHFLKNNKKIFAVFTVSLIFNWIIYYKIWYEGITYQKSFLFVLVMLFCYWIYLSDKKSDILTKLTGIFLLCSFISSGFVISKDIKEQYSGSKLMARYIKENLNDQTVFFVSGYPYYFSPLSAYLPDKKFYMMYYDYYVTYHTFDMNKVKYENERPDAQYCITIPKYALNYGQKIYSTYTDKPDSNKEEFIIYKIK